MRPECIYLTFTPPLPYAIPAVGIITLGSLGHGQTYTQQNNAAFSGAFLWNKLPLTVLLVIHSASSAKPVCAS